MLSSLLPSTCLHICCTTVDSWFIAFLLLVEPAAVSFFAKYRVYIWNSLDVVGPFVALLLPTSSMNDALGLNGMLNSLWHNEYKL